MVKIAIGRRHLLFNTMIFIGIDMFFTWLGLCSVALKIALTPSAR
jgi:hypothetical protein